MRTQGESTRPRTPLVGTPARRPGWIRRTTSIDTIRPDDVDPIRRVDARARDLRTGADGAAVEIEAVRLRARVDPATYRLAAIAAEPADPRLDALVDAPVAGGFRRLLAELLPEPPDQRSLRYSLLDDLPGAQLVAGYDMVRQVEPQRRRPDPEAVLRMSGQADRCAGWADDGTLLAEMRATGKVPAPEGPIAPRLELDEDDAAWHAMGSLPPGGMRRRRRLDLDGADHDGRHRFEAYFRDSHMSDELEETILHEYRLTGTVDAGTRTLVAVAAEALVLPYAECPNALGSARQVVGWTLQELRRSVHRQLVGTTTCTHLNDTLRSVCDLDALLDRVVDRALDDR